MNGAAIASLEARMTLAVQASTIALNTLMATTFDPATAPARSYRRLSPEGWTAQRGIHYGWLIVGVTPERR